MNGVKKSGLGVRQIVVFDEKASFLPGGAHIEGAKERYADYIPEGTAVVKDGDTYKLATILDDIEIATVVGFTGDSVATDAFPLVTVVLAGIVRTSALPALEKGAAEKLKKVLTRITFI